MLAARGPFGEHTAEILKSLGYTDTEAQALYSTGAAA